MFEHEKVFQIIDIFQSTEHSIKSFTFIFQGFCLLNETFGTTLGEQLPMTASANMFYIAIDYKNKTNMKLAASNLDINIHQLFTKQLIIDVRVTIAQRKISGDLKRTCF